MERTVIKASRSFFTYFKEMYQEQEILYFLTWRDLLVHYKQTLIGVVWVILRPLLTASIFTVIFSRITLAHGQNVPYVLLVFCGMLVWQFFTDVFTHGTLSFLSNTHLISKIYFPRIFLPLSRVLCSSVDFCVGFIFYLLIAHGYYRMPFLWNMVFMPLFVFWMITLAFFVTLFFATAIVHYRDVRHMVPFITQIGLYATPVGFSFAMLPFSWRYIIAINPFVGIINGMRWSLLNQQLDIYLVAIGLFVTGIAVLISLWYFTVNERYFADLI